MKTTLILLLLASNLIARDITTLDGTTYRDCRVSKVYPDSICVLFAGGGARIKFANLPEAVAAEFGYESQRGMAFERSGSARAQQERASLDAQLQQNRAKRAATAASRQPPGSQYISPGGSTGAEYTTVNVAGATASTGNQPVNQVGGGYRAAGGQYVAIRMAWPGGGVYGLAYGPTRIRP